MKRDYKGMDMYGNSTRDVYGRSPDECSEWANYNMKATFPYIHYSNSYWNTARTLWGAKEKGILYEYSDLIWQWDHNKAEQSSKTATEKLGQGFTPEWIQLFLTLYHEKPIELRHVMGGVNLSNGYNYYVYGYRIKEA